MQWYEPPADRLRDKLSGIWPELARPGTHEAVQYEHLRDLMTEHPSWAARIVVELADTPQDRRLVADLLEMLIVRFPDVAGEVHAKLLRDWPGRPR